MQESEKCKWSRSIVSNSFRPHGLQPTRLLHPWDFPAKNTGVGCHCLLCFLPYAMLCWVTSVVSDSVWPHRRQPTRLPHPWDSPGKNTGVDCHFLLHLNWLGVAIISGKKIRKAEGQREEKTEGKREGEERFFPCRRPSGGAWGGEGSKHW